MDQGHLRDDSAGWLNAGIDTAIAPMTPRATQWQRWFIRALARESGKRPEEWLQEAKDAGAHASPSSHQGYPMNGQEFRTRK